MAKKIKKPARPEVESSLPRVPVIPKNVILVLDKELVPIAGVFGFGPETKYPAEFGIVDSLRVGQSVSFKVEKLNILNAIRARISKYSNKKFVVKKIDNNHNRMWRVPDGTDLRPGSKQVWKEGAAKAATTKSKKGWGGKRVAGVYSKGKPEGTHKDGAPVVPTNNQPLQ